MEVKVGQIWQNQRGSKYEITGVHGDCLMYKSLDSGLCGGGRIKDWMDLNMPTLVGQKERLSDLEIVKSAIESWGKKYPKLTNFHLAVFADGSFGFHGDGLNYNDHQEIFESDGASMDELLALSKHVIGYKT